MRRIAWKSALVLALVMIAWPAAAREEKEAPPKPGTPAERVAGRWKITLAGLSEDHGPILASFAVEGDLLVGTLTVARESVSLHSGRIIGDQFRFSFDHASGRTFRMRGAPGPRGLEGSWAGDHASGRWTAQRIGRSAR
jgi:hypothetical protein